MGDSLAEGVEGPQGGHGRGWGLVCADRRFEYGPSPLAICGSGGKKGTKGDELGCGGVGRDSAQDSTFDSDDEEQDFDTNAMESGSLRGSPLGVCGRP